MFQLTDHEAKIANFNPRAEKNGDKNNLAADIKFEIAGHSSLLDAFDQQLRSLLYRRPEREGEQMALQEGDQLTALRRPELGTLSWDEEFPGYMVRIANGLAAGKPLELEAELSKFRFEPIQGGSVKVTFSAAVHPNEKAAGRLCDLIQSTVKLTLVPPSAEPDLVGDDGGDGESNQQKAA